jgi:tRNA threonylcarbamoyladenosine biosynthesis protein TsaB
MIVLGFDTATPSTAVALRLADGHTIQARDDPRPGEHPGHATRLLGLAHELLAGAGVRWGAIDRIAVGVGPGTFTGLRVGIATARGLAQSLSVELVGVSSLLALAEEALAADRDADTVLAVIDARRGEAFAGAYEASDGGPPTELVAPAALAPASLGGVLTAVAERARERRWVGVGDGAVRFRGELESLGVALAPDSSPLHRVSAASICELAARSASPAGDLQVLPDYRRRPDAEIALESAAAAGAVGRE